MEKTSFRELAHRAWNLSFTAPIFFIFGCFLAIASVTENFFPAKTSTDIQSIKDLLATGHVPENIPFLMVIAIFLFIIRSFGKGNLIVSIGASASKDKRGIPLTHLSIWKNFSRTLLLEGTVFLFLSGAAAILVIPIFLAFRYNPAVLGIVALGALILFAAIAIIAFFVQEFSLFYRLLSPLRLRSSLENGGVLFSRHTSRCLLFGFFSFALFVLFTFCLNLVMLNIVTLTEWAGFSGQQALISALIALPIFSWWHVFEQSLRYLFFKDLAVPKTEESAEEFTLKDGMPETPTA